MRLQRTILPLTILALIMQGCSWYDNQTTYFNTYYNMNRIMGDVKDEFEYVDEGRRVKPRVLVPGLDSMGKIEGVEGGTKNYQFLKSFIIDRAKFQPVATKVDSILMKGSKILANHPKSDYVEGSLFLMAEGYFFRQEWIPSQQKCVELIERYADGDWSPDAHLLLSKDLLLQRKISQGVQMLSRTVDVAWYKERWDILSEAYRIEAEMAIEDGDLDKAVKPYKQAIAQSENDEVRAKWQVDIGSIYYRMGKFAAAEEAFRKVDDYTPDILAEFESHLYRGASLVQLKRYDEAEEIFAELERNKNYDEWESFIKAERLALERGKSGNLEDPALIAKERVADTSYVGRPELMAQSFQKGMSLYKQNKYDEALIYFAKAKVVRTPVYDVATKYYTLLKQWEDQHRKVAGFQAVIIERETLRDSIKMMSSKEVYSLARVHEELGNKDSALYYYRWAYDSTSERDNDRSKYLYAQARLLSEDDPDASDSLFFVLNEKYPKSPYGKEASASLGFTEESMADDAAELYRSGMSFRRIKDYAYASRQFNTIVTKHENSPYAAKALYALGWMHERDMDQRDSALRYYGILLERYPRSEYAREVRPSVEYALAKMNNVEVADSVLLRDLDDELYKRAKAGELNVMDQMINNNKDALQMNMPGGLQIPNIPGVTPEGGGNLNDVLNNQLKNLKPTTNPGLGNPQDSTRTVPPPPKKP